MSIEFITHSLIAQNPIPLFPPESLRIPLFLLYCNSEFLAIFMDDKIVVQTQTNKTSKQIEIKIGKVLPKVEAEVKHHQPLQTQMPKRASASLKVGKRQKEIQFDDSFGKTRKVTGEIKGFKQFSADEKETRILWQDIRKKEKSLTSHKKENSPTKIKKKKRKIRKVYVYIILALGVLFTALVILIAVPAITILNSFKQLQTVSSEIVSSLNNKDVRNLEAQVGKISAELSIIEDELSRYQFLDSIPLTNGYYKNIKHIQSALTKTNALLVKALPDLKNVLSVTGFTVSDTIYVQTEDSAMSLILSELPRYIEVYSESEPSIKSILADVAALDPAYIPAIPGMNIHSRLEKFQSFAQKFPEISHKMLDFLQFIPELIGAQEPTTYLIILQNEAEMRSSGGLITSYGTMTLRNGEIDGEITLTDTWNLQNFLVAYGVDTGYRNIYGQLFLMGNNCGGYDARAQDVGMYPDLFWSAQAFSDYYDNANAINPVAFPDYDHIVMFDFAFTENLLELIQPLEVEGFGTVNAETLFDFIKSDSDKPELSFSADRKRILAEIANAAKKKFFSLPVDALPKLADTFIESITAKDIALMTDEEDLQAFFDTYALSGRIEKNFSGDYFHLNEAQNCSLKLNKFVRNSVDQKVIINDDGTIDREVNVTWEQKEIFDESKKLIYDGTGKFTYRAWVRLFTPSREVGTYDPFVFESDGFKASNWFPYRPQEYLDKEMDKYMSDNVIHFDHRRYSEEDPIRGTQLNVSYSLPEELNYNQRGSYSLLIQKHPGKSWGEPYEIEIQHKGQTYKTQFILHQDKVLRFKDGVITIENYHKELQWVQDLMNMM